MDKFNLFYMKKQVFLPLTPSEVLKVEADDQLKCSSCHHRKFKHYSGRCGTYCKCSQFANSEYKPIIRKVKELKPVLKRPTKQELQTLMDIEAQRIKRMRRDISNEVKAKYHLAQRERQQLVNKMYEARNSLYNFMVQVQLLEQLINKKDESKDEDDE